MNTSLTPRIRNKAVADGAVSFFLDNFVSARVSKLVFGTLTEILYDPTKPDHVARKATVYQNASGKLVVPNAFDMILPKVGLMLSPRTI